MAAAPAGPEEKAGAAMHVEAVSASARMMADGQDVTPVSTANVCCIFTWQPHSVRSSSLRPS
jgi:hypothetical protein